MQAQHLMRTSQHNTQRTKGLSHVSSLPAPIRFVGESEVSEAQAYVTACQSCDSSAEMSFEYLLEAVIGCDSPTTQYILSRPALCPRCSGELNAKTLAVAR